ncbi:hypothetical protein [Allobranchiibius sp. GilTou38]|uniref:hypothetical protein n=1 Tax=Allobranchiibius sp. GilTou38 TaxID=2815210 RepID=UPI001AA17A39|nr:hypothetical protein [Allobranchiibius sp. GilTou38]MBO1767528.1 hypothetical protein [Allobranchiibius sp. GilTou38]
MPSRLAHTPDATDQRRLFRQSGAMVLGIVTIVICAVILVFGLWSMHRLHAVDIAWPIAVALLAWVLFVRPCVVLTEQAVVIHNLVRDVQIPWAAVESTQSRWNLKVVTTGGAGYGSWAITTQRRRVPRAQRIGLGMGNFRSRAERKQPIDVGAYLNGPERAQSAAAVAASIDEMKAASAPQPTGDTGVRVQPAWWGIAALGAAVVLIVVGLLG